MNVLVRLIAVGIVLAAPVLPPLVPRITQGQVAARTTAVAADTAPAILQYDQGRYDEAIAALRLVVKTDKKNLRAWHYLGLALEKTGDANEARKAHEKAAKLGDQLVKQLDEASSKEAVLRVVAIVKDNIPAAIKSAERYVALNSRLSRSRSQEWQLRAVTFQGLSEIVNAESGIGPIYSAKDVSVKAKILSKPEPAYTEAARRNQTSGTVVMKVIFSAYGRVIGIRVVAALPDGLTENAVKAARAIRFTPALKDGKPVSMYAQLEYTFTIF